MSLELHCPPRSSLDYEDGYPDEAVDEDSRCDGYELIPLCEDVDLPDQSVDGSYLLWHVVT